MVLAKEAPGKGIRETRYESRLPPTDRMKEAVAIKEQASQGVSAKTPIVVFALCALTFASNLALAPDALSIALVLVALGFCLATALGMRYPRWATALFLLTFSAAMLLQVDEFPAFVFLAPFFCGVIAFGGRLLLTVAVTLSAFVLGTLDPTVTSPRDYLESLAPSAVFAWLIFLLLGAGAGWLIGYLDRRNAFLNDSWEADLERTRQDLAETLNDSVAGPLTSVVMQAETMELQLDAEPDSQLDSEAMRKDLHTIVGNSREAMAQSRKLLDLLRSTEQKLSHGKPPSPGQSLSAFTERLKPHGFRVVFTQGSPTKDWLANPSAATPANSISQSQCAALLPQETRQRMLVHRLLMEGATNIVKYATPSSPVVVAVENRSKAHSLCIWNEVARDGTASSALPADLSSDLGLANLQRWAKRTKSTVKTEQETCGSRTFWRLSLRSVSP